MHSVLRTSLASMQRIKIAMYLSEENECTFEGDGNSNNYCDCLTSESVIMD